jgi:hypothetical protein
MRRSRMLVWVFLLFFLFLVLVWRESSTSGRAFPMFVVRAYLY